MTWVVVVTGHPGAGKSTLAKRIGRELGVPVLSKDMVKERLFDTLGVGDEAWSGRLSVASKDLLVDLVRRLLPFTSLIVEANFAVGDVAGLRAALKANRARCVQVVVDAPPAVLAARARRRADTGTRHPGHLDAALAERLAPVFGEPCQPLDLPGRLLRVDGSSRRPRPADVVEDLRRSLRL